MKRRPTIEEIEQHVRVILGEGFVREGLLDLSKLEDADLDACFLENLKHFTSDSSNQTHLTFDNSEHLLKQAKLYVKKREADLACLFYTLWIEHRINLFLRIATRRKKTSETDSISIVRKHSMREKLTWLWRLLDLKPLDKEIISSIAQLEECRNAFVHFKWIEGSFEQDDRSWSAVYNAPQIVESLKDFEEEYVFYGQRNRIADSAKRISMK